jgi:hypothetical protein
MPDERPSWTRADLSALQEMPSVSDARQVYIVISPYPRAGKSTAARMLATIIDGRSIGTSDVIAEVVEAERALAPGTIRAARDINPEDWRPELIAKGDWMADNGLTPGVVAVQRGYHVVEGVRRAAELSRTIAVVEQETGRRPLVVCLIKPLADGEAGPPSDNTEAAGLLALADVTVINDATLDDLRARLVDIVAGHQRAAR